MTGLWLPTFSLQYGRSMDTLTMLALSVTNHVNIMDGITCDKHHPRLPISRAGYVNVVGISDTCRWNKQKVKLSFGLMRQTDKVQHPM